MRESDDDHSENEGQASSLETALNRVTSSSSFVKSPKLKDLLVFLSKKMDRPLSAKEIEAEHFGIPADSHRFDPDHVRALCLEIRKKLERYAAANRHERWQFDLPEAVRGEGYQLRFTKVPHSPAELLWEPHLLDARNVVVVCNSHLFFFDPSQQEVLRFLDVNTEGDNEDAMAELEKRHPKAFDPNLEPMRFYLSSGEVNAFERLQWWFHRQSNVLIHRYVSRYMADRDILSSSPILLGRPCANRFIRRILQSPEAAHLSYRFQQPLGSVKITAPTTQEIEVLSSRFPWTAQGQLGPTLNLEVVFGIVSRMRNPSGQGAITIISADYCSTVITQIATALTDDENARRLLRQMGRSLDETLPESFEMLFAVKRSPGNMEEAEGHAELLTWRL
jgi:hypothetical protein